MANTFVTIGTSPGGAISIDVEYDTSLRIRSITITNNSASTVTATVTRDVISWSLIAPPSNTVTDTLPANLVSFALDDLGNPAIPSITLLAYWTGYFDVWHISVVIG